MVRTTRNPQEPSLTPPATRTILTNWSKSAHSPCLVYQASGLDAIANALAAARTSRLSVIAHGAGHSYTDAALNSGAIVVDLTPMRRILDWDPVRGIMQVEPGVTLRDMVQVAWKDGWWPVVSPSTPVVTVGGCIAMNVNGKNAWKDGPFGAQVRSLDVFFSTGETRTLLPEADRSLFHAVVGSVGLLGFITRVTVQLQRLGSGRVVVRRRRVGSLEEIFPIVAEEQPASDFLEVWLDGFPGGRRLGRGYVTCATVSRDADQAPAVAGGAGAIDRLETPVVRWVGSLARPVLVPGVRLTNLARSWWTSWDHAPANRQLTLPAYTYWPPAAFAGYHALFPQGVETLQAFVPAPQAPEVFGYILRLSQQRRHTPLWCVMKAHRRDPFLLSYQVDGFSLELNYQRTSPTPASLERMLRQIIAMVIEAGGRFYLAKDHFLTPAQYRHSVGDAAVDTFLQLKRQYDPEMLLQSDLFRRVFQPVSGQSV